MQNVLDSPTSFLQARKKTDDSLRWITLGVLIIHLLGTWYALYFSPSVPIKESRQKVVVKTVQLNPRLQPIAPMIETVQEAPIVQNRVPISQSIPEHTSPSFKEKKEEVAIVIPTTIEQMDVKPELKKELEKKTINEPPKKVAATPPKKIQSPKVETPKKTLTPPPKAPAQTTQKNPPKAKTTATQAPVKKAPEPPKPKPKVETKKEPSAAEIAALKAEMAKQKELEAAAEAARVRQQELLAKAKQNVAKIGESRSKIASSPSKVPSLGEAEIPRQLENLQIDALPIGTGAITQLSTKEASYRDEVAQRLKLGLRLPDYGEVKIKLTLSRSGKVEAVQIVSSESPKNKQYIERTVPTLIFPTFGTQFTEASQYSFLITLNNDY